MARVYRESASPHSGYTLVELSIVIIIISLLTASGLAMGSSMIERAAYVDSRKLLDHISQSLKDYYIVNGRLPCVANMSTLPGATGFGEELEDCNDGTAGPTGTWRRGSPAVRIGMVPSRTLGLSDSAASDKFGNRIVYAVTERLTDNEDFGAAPGAITIQDMNDNDILADAAYILISPGRDHKGAYAYSTGDTHTGCTGTDNLDVPNCDFSDVDFRDAPFNSGDVEDMFFDDLVHWVPKFHFMAYDTQSSNLWSSNGENIFSVGTDDNPATTSVGIGTADPTQGKLHVEGGPIYVSNMWLGESGDTLIGPDIHMDHSGLVAADDSLSLVINGANGPDTRSVHFLKGGLNLTDATAFAMLTTNSSLFLGLDGTSSYISGSSAMNQRLWIEATQSYDNGAAIALYGKNEAEFPGSIRHYATIASSSTDAHKFLRRWGGDTNTLFSIRANGDVWRLGDFIGSSDARLKKDIVPITGALGKLSSINGVYFRWNGKDDHTDTESRQIGLIAQEVQTVFPDAVKEGEDGYLALNAIAIIPPLVEAVKELDAKNTALESRISELEAHPANAGEDNRLNYWRAAVIVLLCGIFLLLLRKGRNR